MALNRRRGNGKNLHFQPDSCLILNGASCLAAWNSGIRISFRERVLQSTNLDMALSVFGRVRTSWSCDASVRGEHFHVCTFLYPIRHFSCRVFCCKRLSVKLCVSDRARPSLVTKFGQTKFGQDQVWPGPSLTKTKFGQTKFGQDQVWPDQVWPRPSLARPSAGQSIRSVFL